MIGRSDGSSLRVRTVRRVLIVLAALAMAMTVVYVWRSSTSDKICETTMEFDGVRYDTYELTEEIVGKDDVGVGVERGCGDDGVWSEEVAVSRIAGVDSQAALVTPVAARVVYVAEDVAIDELPSRISGRVVRQVAGRLP